MNGKGPKPDSSDFDPNSFETINENKNLNEILGNLDKPQKYFIMRELKVFCPIKNIGFIISFVEYKRVGRS